MPTKPYVLAVKALVFDKDGQCLLLRRSPNNRSFVGCWEWPGGKVDDGEDFATATAREMKEEAGLEIELCALAGATEFETPQVRVVLLCMEAKVLGGELKLSHEHDAAAWVHPRDFGAYTLPPGVGDFMLSQAAKLAERQKALQ